MLFETIRHETQHSTDYKLSLFDLQTSSYQALQRVLVSLGEVTVLPSPAVVWIAEPVVVVVVVVMCSHLVFTLCALVSGAQIISPMSECVCFTSQGGTTRRWR